MFPFYWGQKPEGLKKLVYHRGFEREIHIFKKASLRLIVCDYNSHYRISNNDQQGASSALPRSGPLSVVGRVITPLIGL